MSWYLVLTIWESWIELGKAYVCPRVNIHTSRDIHDNQIPKTLC